jgi:hypothetical protein
MLAHQDGKRPPARSSCGTAAARGASGKAYALPGRRLRRRDPSGRADSYP